MLCQVGAVSTTVLSDFFLYMKPDRRERRESLCVNLVGNANYSAGVQTLESLTEDDEARLWTAQRARRGRRSQHPSAPRSTKQPAVLIQLSS
jgi:hypothetical protein